MDSHVRPSPPGVSMNIAPYILHGTMGRILRKAAFMVALLGCGALACSAAAENPAGEAAQVSNGSGDRGGRIAEAQRPAGRITFPSGRVFYVDLALTLAEQQRGYMWRKTIAPEEGLLFIYERPGIRKFWMKNCLTAMDMIWLDRAGRVIAIEHSAPPCEADPCPSFGPDQPSFNVLEVAPGVAREEGLEPGDQLSIVTDHHRP